MTVASFQQICDPVGNVLFLFKKIFFPLVDIQYYMKINILRIILNEMWQMRFPLQLVRLTFESMISFQIALLNISATISVYKPSTRVLLLPCFPLNTSFHF